MSACPTCGRDWRCPEERGAWRCQGENGHPGDHWIENGHQRGAVLRWSVVSFYGCPDTSCILDPGHALPHKDGRGRAWAPVEVDSALGPGDV